MFCAYPYKRKPEPQRSPHQQFRLKGAEMMGALRRHLKLCLLLGTMLVLRESMAVRTRSQASADRVLLKDVQVKKRQTSAQAHPPAALFPFVASSHR